MRFLTHHHIFSSRRSGAGERLLFDLGNTGDADMMCDPTSLVIHATYGIHPEEVTAFASAVSPYIAAHAALPGYIYYSFAPNILD